MTFTEISQNKKIPDTSCIKDLKEARAGFEPAVKVLQTSALPLGYGAIKLIENTIECFLLCGADYETRTRYLHLGKVTLYRMS